MTDVNDIKNKTNQMMDKSIHALNEDLKSIRTGRASITILDHVMVECYGNKMHINQLANLTVPEPRSILIEPWDKSNLHDIEKALLKSDLHVTPTNDGKLIRLNFPPLTEDRRRELVKQVKQRGELAKVSIRNVRKDANDDIKHLEQDGHISKDDVKHIQDDVQKTTDKYIEKINQVIQKKENEIMEI